MPEEGSDFLGSPESIATHLKLLLGWCDLCYDRILPVAKVKALKDPPGERLTWAVVASLTQSILDSSSSLGHLVVATKVRDSYVTCRTILLTAINCCFVLAGGEAVAQRARKHAMQRSYRDLNRELTVAGQAFRLAWTGSVDLEANPELAEALKEFTTKKGREIREWTPENVVQQIEMITARFGQPLGTRLQAAWVVIFRHASEIAHGTFFGEIFSWGATEPGGVPKTQEEWDRHLGSQLATLCLVVGFALEAVFATLACELDVQGLQEPAEALWVPVLAQTWLRGSGTET